MVMPGVVGWRLSSGFEKFVSLARRSCSEMNCGAAARTLGPLDDVGRELAGVGDAVEPPRPTSESVNYKVMLPREYLVKWADRSYRRTTWVPHGWLLATSGAKLKNFLQGGSKVQLLPEAVEEEKADELPASQGPSFEIGGEGTEDAPANEEKSQTSALSANPDAQRKIPPAWKRVDRILDVLLWRPERRLGANKRGRGRPAKGKGKAKGKKRADTDEEEVSDDEPRIFIFVKLS